MTLKNKPLKIVGEIILLVSFLCQTFLFDYYNDKSRELDQAYLSQSLIDHSAELKELKYFVGVFPGDTLISQEYRTQNINLAAQKLALSQIIAILVSQKSNREKIDLSNLLNEKSSKVVDFVSYEKFIDFINDSSLKVNEVVTNIDVINTNKRTWRWVFITLYVIGTGLLIYSKRFEKLT
jgi:hypothetical protein